MDPTRAGASLSKGAYLYTALVHQHRASGQRSRRRSYFTFMGLEERPCPPVLMGRNADIVSRTYFAGSVSPQELIRRHTLIGYLNLAEDEDEALVREEGLISGRKNVQISVFGETFADLRWCKLCAKEDRERNGFAEWKVVHQISSIRICHIHGNPLCFRCVICGTTPGSPVYFRLPGEACPTCNQNEFEEDGVDVKDAYRTFVQDVASVFERQDNYFRNKCWLNLISKFISSYPSKIKAERDVIDYLCRYWDVGAPIKIWDLIQTSPPGKKGIFEKSNKSLSVRILINRAIQVLQSDFPLGEIRALSLRANQDRQSRFASVVKVHAEIIGLSEDLANALMSPVSLKDAAEAVDISYDRLFYFWQKLLRSMRDSLGDQVLREMLPEGRNFNKYPRIGSRSDLLEAYKTRLSLALELDPNIGRKDLWSTHYRAMRYVSRKDYEWLAKMVGGNHLSKRPGPE